MKTSKVIWHFLSLWKTYHSQKISFCIKIVDEKMNDRGGERNQKSYFVLHFGRKKTVSTRWGFYCNIIQMSHNVDSYTKHIRVSVRWKVQTYSWENYLSVWVEKDIIHLTEIRSSCLGRLCLWNYKRMGKNSYNAEEVCLLTWADFEGNLFAFCLQCSVHRVILIFKWTNAENLLPYQPVSAEQDKCAQLNARLTLFTRILHVDHIFIFIFNDLFQFEIPVGLRISLYSLFVNVATFILLENVIQKRVIKELYILGKVHSFIL